MNKMAEPADKIISVESPGILGDIKRSETRGKLTGF